MKRLAGADTSVAMVATFLAVLISTSLGCSDGLARNSAGYANTYSTRASSELDKVLQSWPADTAPTLEAVERFRRLSDRTDWDKALRVSTLSEDEFAALPESQRTEIHERLLNRFGRLKSLAEATAERVEVLRAKGDGETAEEYLEAVRRAGRANSGEHLTFLSRMVGESILRLAAKYGRAEAN